MRELTRDFELNGRRYQLTKMTAQTASWVHSVLVSVAIDGMRKAIAGGNGQLPPEESAASNGDMSDPVAEARGAVAYQWMMAGTTLGEEVYGRVFQHCLRCCRYYEDGAPTPPAPVVMADGRVAAPNLRDDAEAQGLLVLESLQFNLAPFFIAAASKLSAKASAVSSQ